MHSLSEIYLIQQNLTDAEPLLKKALEIKEKLLGSKHASVETLKNNLAALYGIQGKYAEAELLLKQVLATIENELAIII